jgi:DNA excision repair protein ERCC-1
VVRVLEMMLSSGPLRHLAPSDAEKLLAHRPLLIYVSRGSGQQQAEAAQRPLAMLLPHIRNVGWEYAENIRPDLVLSSSVCVYLLLVSYHILHPHFIVRRMKDLGRDYRSRVLIAIVDGGIGVSQMASTSDDKAFVELNKLCFVHDFTLVLAWSAAEAGRYVETLKVYESKPSVAIQEKAETEFIPQVTRLLTTVPSVNKTDAATLMSGFSSVAGVCRADDRQLVLCPGVGAKKARRLFQVLHAPLHSSRTRGSKLRSAPTRSAVYESQGAPSATTPGELGLGEAQMIRPLI